MTFRDRLLSTIRAARPVLEAPGILVVGSEVPNLIEPGAAATLVVSQDLDIGVPVEAHQGMPDPGPRRADIAALLEPRKTILFASAERAARIPGALAVPVRLGGLAEPRTTHAIFVWYISTGGASWKRRRSSGRGDRRR